MREISRSSSVFKVVPDLGRVHRREQRVEVRILSSPTKVICGCDIYIHVHVTFDGIATNIVRALQEFDNMLHILQNS